MFAEQLAATPKLTFVVISGSDTASLDSLLQRLGPLCDTHRVELLVVTCSAGSADGPFETIAGVRVIAANAEGSDFAALRRAGFAHATGDVVAFCCDTDDGACERLWRLIETYGLAAQERLQDDLRNAGGTLAVVANGSGPQLLPQAANAVSLHRDRLVGSDFQQRL